MSGAFQYYPAPAKVNLFLHVTGRRADGYHLLQSVFRLLEFGDTIGLKVREDGVIRRVTEVHDVPEELDLCVRAARLLQSFAKTALGVDITVEKRIPMGGGLGGGSSDAATVLLGLNRLWQLNLDRKSLMALALKLGADVPVFVFGENAWAEGIGEELQSIALKPAWYVLLTPQVNVSTAEVFGDEELTRDTNPTTIADFSRGLVHNDLEAVVRRKSPAVAAALEWLNQFSRARMSGSGATVFIEVESEQQAQEVLAAKPETLAGLPVFGCVAKGLDKHPLHAFAEQV